MAKLSLHRILGLTVILPTVCVGAGLAKSGGQFQLGPPLHPGAASFYEKDKPSFLKANADVLGFMLTVAIMAGSWIWEFQRWIQRKQKNTADRYSNRAMALMAPAFETTSAAELEMVWRSLLAILTEAVGDPDADKLSEESFASFRSILDIALDVTKDRRSVAGATPIALSAQTG